MKKMKRLAALFLAVVMVMAMGMTAFATEANPVGPDGTKEENGTYKLTITTPVANHAYQVYQIYTGDVSTKVESGKEVGVLSNIKYGQNYHGADKLAETGQKLSDTDLTALKAETDGAALAKKIDANLVGVVWGTLGKVEGKADAVTEINVPGGYYLVKDVWAGEKAAPANEQYSNFVISIVGATSFSPKTLEEPGFDKKASIDGSEVVVVSDKKVGDTVNFKLTATLPDDFGNYAEYKIVFHDTLSEGLDYVGNAKVTVVLDDTTKLVDADAVNDIVVGERDTTTGDLNISYTIDDVFNYKGLTSDTAKGATIIVTYDAKINDNAKVNLTETNKATLEYTNGSSDSQNGKTPEKIVTVLLAELDITKTDGDVETRTLLPGAGFKLYRYDSNKENKKGELVEEITSVDATDTTEAVLISEFKFKGLEAGKYVLEESKTPAGYNTIEDKYFEITFSGTPDNGLAEAEMVNLSVKEITKDGVEITEDNHPLKWEAEEGNKGNTASLDIKNVSGAILPSTGGIGTTIFYVVGGILVLGAAVLLITKKRMSARNE